MGWGKSKVKSQESKVKICRAACLSERINKVVAIAGGLDTTEYRPGVMDQLSKNTGDDYGKMLPASLILIQLKCYYYAGARTRLACYPD